MSATAIRHALSRLRDIGIHDVFGAPGDLSFPLNDALCSENALQVHCLHDHHVDYGSRRRHDTQ